MALQSLETSSGLSALTNKAESSAASARNWGDLTNLIKDDQNPAHPLVHGYDKSGLLTIPGRGTLNVLPGDVVAVDSEGWPILVSANSIANGNWTLT